jgi:hypothetical protein
VCGSLTLSLLCSILYSTLALWIVLMEVITVTSCSCYTIYALLLTLYSALHGSLVIASIGVVTVKRHAHPHYALSTHAMLCTAQLSVVLMSDE